MQDSHISPKGNIGEGETEVSWTAGTVGDIVVVADRGTRRCCRGREAVSVKLTYSGNLGSENIVTDMA